MKKLLAVVIIIIGCKVAECQEAGMVKPPAVDTTRKIGPAAGMVKPAAGDTIREVSMTAGWGSKVDTVPRFNWRQQLPAWKQPFPYQSFIVPAAMIAYGATAVHNHSLQSLNGHIQEQVWQDNPHKTTSIDNYLQFGPAMAVYGLNALGIHGAHNLKDRTMLFVMASAIADGSVLVVKGWSHELRPDGSNYLSFPSGHTAQAFASAEFMRLEYKDVSPWYGVAGYAMATATGLLRMYNNKHWMSDVVAGAGVGIASTRLAYWLYPKMQHWFGKKDAGDNAPVTMLMPTYQNGAVGLSYVKNF